MNSTDLQKGSDIDRLVTEWLVEKTKRTGSAKTEKAYRDTMTSFRETLSHGGCDLLDDPVNVARVASIWASLRVSSGIAVPVEASTYNQRLAISR